MRSGTARSPRRKPYAAAYATPARSSSQALTAGSSTARDDGHDRDGDDGDDGAGERGNPDAPGRSPRERKRSGGGDDRHDGAADGRPVHPGEGGQYEPEREPQDDGDRRLDVTAQPDQHEREDEEPDGRGQHVRLDLDTIRHSSSQAHRASVAAANAGHANSRRGARASGRPIARVSGTPLGTTVVSAAQPRVTDAPAKPSAITASITQRRLAGTVPPATAAIRVASAPTSANRRAIVGKGVWMPGVDRLRCRRRLRCLGHSGCGIRTAGGVCGGTRAIGPRRHECAEPHDQDGGCRGREGEPAVRSWREPFRGCRSRCRPPRARGARPRRAPPDPGRPGVDPGPPQCDEGEQHDQRCGAHDREKRLAQHRRDGPFGRGRRREHHERDEEGTVREDRECGAAGVIETEPDRAGERDQRHPLQEHERRAAVDGGAEGSDRRGSDQRRDDTHRDGRQREYDGADVLGPDDRPRRDRHGDGDQHARRPEPGHGEPAHEGAECAEAGGDAPADGPRTASERHECDGRDGDRGAHDHDRDAGPRRPDEDRDRGHDRPSFAQAGAVERGSEEQQPGDDHRGDRAEDRGLEVGAGRRRQDRRVPQHPPADGVLGEPHAEHQKCHEARDTRRPPRR